VPRYHSGTLDIDDLERVSAKRLREVVDSIDNRAYPKSRRLIDGDGDGSARRNTRMRSV